MTAGEILAFLATALTGGVVGGLAMEGVMVLFNLKGWARGSMVVALGSLVTGSRSNSRKAGVIVHLASAVFFSIAYSVLLLAAGLDGALPSIALGLGIGFLHGVLVSLALVWVVSDRHPLEEFRGADFAIGLSHLAGHVAFGAGVGLVFGLSPF